MFARRLNELHLTLELHPVDQLLLKEGRHLEGRDKERRFFHRGAHVARTPSRPRLRGSRDFGDYDSAEGAFDMAFVFTRTASGAERFYLPGSSLRGALRQAAEQVVARLRPDLLGDPFVQRPDAPFCGTDHQLRRARELDPTLRLDGPTIYSHALPIERCFGHSLLKGRWVIADALMPDEPGQFQRGQAAVAVRDGVGIDRRTGAARNQVKYQYEALSGAVFATELTLTNYERWQPGLLAHALAAIDGGSVRLGYGTRRGLGRVRVAVRAMRWRWYGPDPRQSGALATLPALSALAARAGLSVDYGWHEPEADGPPLSLDLTAGELCWEATEHPPVEGLGTDWSAAPWPALAALLPPALQTWQRKEVLNAG